MKLRFHLPLHLGFLVFLFTTLRLHADVVSLTLSPLPNMIFNDGSEEARVDILSVDLAPQGADLVGQPGEVVGWSFKINWASNAGDSLVFSGSRLTPSEEWTDLGKYADLLGDVGGNQGESVHANTQWSSPEPFDASTDGIGSFTIHPDAEPGTKVSGTLRLEFKVYAGSGDTRVKIGSFYLPLEVSVTVGAVEAMAQTITFPEIADKMITDAPFALGAQASSDLPVMYISLNPDLCTVENGVATVLGSGRVGIVALQEGNARYSAARSVTRHFEVLKNTATITLQGTLDHEFDGSDKPLTATTQPTGLNVTLLYNGESTPPRAPGIYIVDAVIEDPAYTGTAQARMTITEMNETPTDITLTPSSIAENNAAGATVGKLAALDADVGQTHTFTKVTGTGDTDNGSFTIAGTDLKLTSVADFETKSSYSVRVQADDGNGGTFAKALTVTITDVYEAPVPVFLGSSGGTSGNGSGIIDAPSADATASLGKWASLRSGAVLSSNGHIAFRGFMELGTGTPPVTVNDFQGIWRYDGTDTRLKARSGSAAPDTGNALFDQLPLNPSISPNGLITFYGTLRMGTGSPATTSSINYGLWSELGGGSARLLLRRGDTIVPGKLFRSGFAFATSSVNTAALNARLSSGTALLHLDVNTPSVLLTVVAEEGQTGPGGGTWIALDGNSSDPRLSANGDLGFIGWEKVGTSQIQGIYSRLNSTPVGTSGAVVQARVGSTAPGTSGATFNAFERPTVFNGGMAFRGFLNANGDNAGGTKGQGVWAGAFGALTPVVRTGDTTAQIPTVPAGRTVSSVWSPFSNALGSLTMRVSLVGAGETRAIMGSTGGTMRIIAKVGDAAPGLAGETFTNFDHPVIGDGDQVAFIAATNTGSYGIWKQAPGGGALSLVMKAGDTISTSEGDKVVSLISLPGTTTDDRKFETRCMDALGRLLIHVTFSDGSTSLLLGL